MSLSIGTIAGIVVGVIVGIIAISLGAYFGTKSNDSGSEEPPGPIARAASLTFSGDGDYTVAYEETTGVPTVIQSGSSDTATYVGVISGDITKTGFPYKVTDFVSNVEIFDWSLPIPALEMSRQRIVPYVYDESLIMLTANWENGSRRDIWYSADDNAMEYTALGEAGSNPGLDDNDTNYDSAPFELPGSNALCMIVLSGGEASMSYDYSLNGGDSWTRANTGTDAREGTFCAAVNLISGVPVNCFIGTADFGVMRVSQRSYFERLWGR